MPVIWDYDALREEIKRLKISLARAIASEHAALRRAAIAEDGCRRAWAASVDRCVLGRSRTSKHTGRLAASGGRKR
jgi:hypothetical protein